MPIVDWTTARSLSIRSSTIRACIRDAAAPTEMTSARADRPSSNASLVRTLRRAEQSIH